MFEPPPATHGAASRLAHALDLGSHAAVERAHAMAPKYGETSFAPSAHLLDRLPDLARDTIAHSALRNQYLAQLNKPGAQTYSITFDMGDTSEHAANAHSVKPLPAAFVDHPVLHGILQRQRLEFGHSYLLPLIERDNSLVPCKLEHGDPQRAVIVTLARRERDLPRHRAAQDRRITVGNSPAFRHLETVQGAELLDDARRSVKQYGMAVQEHGGYFSANYWEFWEHV